MFITDLDDLAFRTGQEPRPERDLVRPIGPQLTHELPKGQHVAEILLLAFYPFFRLGLALFDDRISTAFQFRLHLVF